MIKFNSLVKLHYSISSIDNIIFESTFGSEPVLVRIGDGTLPIKLEMTLYGLVKDNEQTMTLEPKDAFGLRDENNNKTLEISTFPDTEMVKVGNVIEIDVKEKDGKVSPAFAMIKQVGKDSVLLDLNHPLSGHKIIFKVKIINIDE
jgi:FKBP-type peptidyl-prolyl cis-trans isomerase 2|tara:strand:- start:196 stop:633 length:438 start_codon:yes stop_codon:yes gene_type:complete